MVRNKITRYFQRRKIVGPKIQDTAVSIQTECFVVWNVDLPVLVKYSGTFCSFLEYQVTVVVFAFCIRRRKEQFLAVSSGILAEEGAGRMILCVVPGTDVQPYFHHPTGISNHSCYSYRHFQNRNRIVPVRVLRYDFSLFFSEL